MSMSWTRARIVSFLLTIINFVLNPVLVCFSPWGTWVNLPTRVVVSLCAVLPHSLGFCGCLCEVMALLITYIVFTIINIVLWSIGVLVEIYMGVKYTNDEHIWSEQNFTKRKWNYTKPVEYYTAYGREYLIGGGIGVIYCAFQIILVCFYFKMRKEICDEKCRRMSVGITPVRQEPSDSCSARTSEAA